MGYFCHLNCEYCEEVYSTSRALYWHLRKHHDFNHDDAFNSVGNSIDKSAEDWGHDDRTAAARTDRTKEGSNWNSHYSRGKDHQVKYFSK